MRVNVTYSVKLDEVPGLTRKLLAEATKNLEILFKEHRKINGELEKENEKKAIQLIKECRQLMSDADHCLADSYNILMGYEQTLLRLRSENEEAGRPTNDSLEDG
jgi:hypothetical protein